MRALLRRTTDVRTTIARFLDENAWVPLAGKALGVAVSMLVLATIGSGALDGALDLGPPRAEAAAMAPVPRPRASVAASSVPSLAPAAAIPAAASASAPSAPPRVVLNTASEAELIQLPGVGPAKAKAILALRDKLGRFRRFEDLLRVRGIKRRSLERIRERAVLDPPPPEEVAPPPSASAVPSAGPPPPKATGGSTAASAAPPTW
jgi:competence protein ComEA